MTNQTITPAWPWIVFTYRRQPRQIQPYYDHIVCLLTNENNKKLTIIRSHIVITDERQQQQTNHNTTTYCAYWLTTTINPTIIRPYTGIVFTDGRHQQQIQPYYDHMLSSLTNDNHDKSNLITSTVCLLMDENNDKSNFIMTTCWVHWRTTTTTNPTIIPPLIVFTDEW